MTTVIVRGGATGFAQEIEAGRHRLVADEPVEIANRCPVHRTLVSEINGRTRLV